MSKGKLLSFVRRKHQSDTAGAQRAVAQRSANEASIAGRGETTREPSLDDGISI